MRKVLFCVIGCGFCIESSATTETITVVNNAIVGRFEEQARNIGKDPLVQNANVASVFAKIVKVTGVELRGTQNPSDLSEWLPEFTFNPTQNEALDKKFGHAKELVDGVRRILQSTKAKSEEVVKLYAQLKETTNNGFYDGCNAIISGMILNDEKQKPLRERVDKAWQLLWQARDALDYKMAQWGYWSAVEDLSEIEMLGEESPVIGQLRNGGFFGLLFGWICTADPTGAVEGLSGDAEGRPLTKAEQERTIRVNKSRFLARVTRGSE